MRGAWELCARLPRARAFLADRAYDANWLRGVLEVAGIEACIPTRRTRKVFIAHDKVLYKQRHRVENSFAKLKDWLRVALRRDRCAHTYMSAVKIAAIMIFWLKE